MALSEIKKVLLTKQGEFPYGALLSDGRILIQMADGFDLGDYLILTKEQFQSLINDGLKSKCNVTDKGGWKDGLIRISNGGRYPDVICVTIEQFEVIRELGKELVI